MNNNIVYIIMVENQYKNCYVERVYTSLETAKNFLIENYNFWVKEENKNLHDIKEINEVTTENLLNSDFYVDLDRRGSSLILFATPINEKIEIV